MSRSVDLAGANSTKYWLVNSSEAEKTSRFHCCSSVFPLYVGRLLDRAEAALSATFIGTQYKSRNHDMKSSSFEFVEVDVAIVEKGVARY